MPRSNSVVVRIRKYVTVIVLISRAKVKSSNEKATAQIVTESPQRVTVGYGLR